MYFFMSNLLLVEPDRECHGTAADRLGYINILI